MTGCAQFRHSLGVVALGAADPAERDQVLEHAGGCDACAAELNRLRDAVAALALIDNPDSEPASITPSADMLADLLTRVRRARIRRRVAAVMVAAALVVLAGIGGLLAGGADTTEPPASDAATDDASAPPDAVASGDADGVAVEVTAWDRGWGTAVQAAVTGVPSGTRCSLVAVGADGTEEIAATWVVPSNGYEDEGGSLVVDGAVGLRSWDVDHYAIVTTDGDTLVTADS